MPSGPIAHISFLVNDLDQAIEDWTKILSVLDPAQLQRPIVRYDEFDGGGDKMRWCTFVSDHGVEIQLMEPDPASKLGERLAKKGEHVHHICLTTPTLEKSLGELQEKGIELTGEISQDPNLPWQRWGWVSAKSAHGILLEIAHPYETHDDGNWHPAADAIAAE
jgi:methylmalonyl-CoA/ethylmalonyl-CoA epimerase